MKQFDLAAAKAGAPVCTKCGENARIICTDRVHNIYTLVVLVDKGEYEDMKTYSATGIYDIKSCNYDDDLMMRDDDYAEKLARGEYTPSIKGKLTVENPTCKESLPVDWEYWRRMYAGQITPVILNAAIITRAKVKDEYKDMPAEVAVARSAIALADALIAELEKK